MSLPMQPRGERYDHRPTLESLLAALNAGFVPRGEYAENRDNQNHVLERLANSIDELNVQLREMPSRRELDDLTRRMTDLERRQGQGQRLQVATLFQQNKVLLGALAGAAVALLGAFMQGHIHIQ